MASDGLIPQGLPLHWWTKPANGSPEPAGLTDRTSALSLNRHNIEIPIVFAETLRKDFLLADWQPMRD